ncbi:MAG: hypothetical protein ABIJ21_06395 [Nanoarchaeota archaeon]
MSGFEDYYNIKEFPQEFLDDLKELNKSFKEKHPHWTEIQVLKDQWPEGNMLHLNYCDLALNDISEIDSELQKLFQKHNVQFEISSGGYTDSEEG